MNYYNDNDPFAIKWLNALIKSKLIPGGVVDGRSIADIKPSDLDGFTQCHFFAGIGGWAYALQLAGWPEQRPVWTGSCPCQPFSRAGRQGGLADERHLWPAFRRLIEQRKPPVVFGEQITSKIAREKWLPGVQTDLETLGYSTAAADLCSAGVGAPNIRQRIWWVGVGRERGEFKGFQGGPEKTVQQVVRSNQWAQSSFTRCSDRKYRRIPSEPTLFPLAPRIPGRVGLLRGSGNSINPVIAAEFVKAFMEVQNYYDLL